MPDQLPALVPVDVIYPMSDRAIEIIGGWAQDSLSNEEQIPLKITQTLHGWHDGTRIYSRAMFVPAGVKVIATLIKPPTTMIVSGDMLIVVGDDKMVRHTGFKMILAYPHRRQAGIAITDTWVVMQFPTKAETVEEAEREFTDEHEMLASHRDGLNEIVITGV